MAVKTKRHAKILEIISSYAVDTQEELLGHLKKAGFDVTQATVSRDIKELRLIKTLGSDGRYRYSTMKQEPTAYPPSSIPCFRMQCCTSISRGTSW